MIIDENGKRRSNSMEHCNGDQFCALDIVASGPDPFMDEIIHISILPLKTDLTVRKDVMPFSVNLVPHYPERIQKPAASILELLRSGFDKDKATDLLCEWKKKLNFEATEFGIEKRIIVLAYNYAFQRPFIERWLSPEIYSSLFTDYHRDVLQTAAYLNEQASFHARRVPYSKLRLSWLAKQHNVECPAKAPSLPRARGIAQVYKAQCLSGLF